MKLRVIVRNSEEYPYELQIKRSKWSLFWEPISVYPAENSAILAMHSYKLKPKPGTVISTYTEQDRLVDKLKGINYE